MRFFIAVEADEEATSAAAAVIARLRQARGSFRWVDPRDMHTTLRYFGPTPQEKLSEIKSLMAAAAAVTPPFEVVYGGVGAFDSFEESRVVWIGVEKGRESLESLTWLLQRDEARPYTPHLTLGRNREPSAPAEFVAAIKAEPVLKLRRPVRKICLYASKPTSFGHAYDILHSQDLTGPG